MEEDLLFLASVGPCVEFYADRMFAQSANVKAQSSLFAPELAGSKVESKQLVAVLKFAKKHNVPLSFMPDVVEAHAQLAGVETTISAARFTIALPAPPMDKLESALDVPVLSFPGGDLHILQGSSSVTIQTGAMTTRIFEGHYVAQKRTWSGRLKVAIREGSKMVVDADGVLRILAGTVVLEATSS